MMNAAQVRETVLLTLIELGVQKNADRDSLCVGLDAYTLLTGKTLEGAHVDHQLQKLYPHLCTPETDEEKEFKAAAEGKIRPIAIYHRGDALVFFNATEEDREAWNVYAQEEADKFDNDPRLDSYDSTRTHSGVNRDGNITSWCPPKFFPEWLAGRRQILKVLTAKIGGKKVFFHSMFDDGGGIMAPYWMPNIEDAQRLTDVQVEALKTTVLPRIQANNISYAFEDAPVGATQRMYYVPGENGEPVKKP